MARDKTAVDFVASIEVIEANLELFHRGTRPVYRPVATELRKLMCDGAASLLPRVFDEIRLHKLWTTERYERLPERLRQATYFSCSTLLVTRTATRATLDLAESAARLPLDEWLRQPFMSPSISIGAFVRSVADKEGAHAAPRPNATLAFTGSIHYGGGNADLSHAHEISALAEYIAWFVRTEDLRLRHGIGLFRKQVGDRWEVA